MKTNPYFTLCVATVFTILTSCNSQSTQKEPSAEGTQTNGIITQPETKKHLIPVADIQEMIGKYKSERQEAVNKNSELLRSYGENFQDTRCAWFSIDELKSFIAEVEKNPTNKLSGIRMYFTVYPEKREGESEYMSTVSASDRNHVSLLLVPTYQDEKTKSQVDFGAEGDEQGEHHDTGGDMKGRSAASVAAFAPALNHAALCPPNCPTGF